MQNSKASTFPHLTPQPRLGLQGPVVGWQDPWAGAASDAIMRTGTGVLLDSQDGRPTPGAFLDLMKNLGADFYVHHVMPDLTGQQEMLADTGAAGLDVVLGNEYGNINGPFVPGTNRFDIPLQAVKEAAGTGRLLGLLYDEPEHLQINADQYRKDAFLPHFGVTQGFEDEAAEQVISESIETRAAAIRAALSDSGQQVPLLSEQVFPVLFHTFARAGMTPCPKVMKESFHPIQLSTALGASLQYNRELWMCVDLWGPDVGPWFTRAPGFPGHSPAEYASALRLAYYFGPTHLFTENLDVLARLQPNGDFARTEFGDVWEEFARAFVPANPLHWRHSDAQASTVIIHAEDSNYGQGSQPFGRPDVYAPDTSASIFHVWHMLSHGVLPLHGSCMHIEGYDFPRHRLNGLDRQAYPFTAQDPASASATHTHPLFQPMNNVLVFDEKVSDAQLGEPGLIVVAGSRLPEETLGLLRSRADRGATVVIAEWLTNGDSSTTQRLGLGQWVVVDDFRKNDKFSEAIQPHLGPKDLWTQRFGDTELQVTPANEQGTTLSFDVVN